MAVLFRSPELEDYFVERPDVRQGGQFRPAIDAFEDGKVISLPNLKFDIDFDFWSSVETDAYPGLKKLSSSPDPTDPGLDRKLDRTLELAGLPAALERRLRAEIRAIYDQVAPVYEQLFAGYRFKRRQVVWRLNTIMNENMHVDTYVQDFDDHFARLFINLDSQPRIWATSYTIEQLFDLYGAAAMEEIGPDGGPGELRLALNRRAFHGRSAIWWDRQPRHYAYFAPGDAWIVDSRQVAHQIFYGRRAVSFDFFVDPASMNRPDRYYLAHARSLMASAPAAAARQVTAATDQG
jgi:hypothetical protein